MKGEIGCKDELTVGYLVTLANVQRFQIWTGIFYDHQRDLSDIKTAKHFQHPYAGREAANYEKSYTRYKAKQYI